MWPRVCSNMKPDRFLHCVIRNIWPWTSTLATSPILYWCSWDLGINIWEILLFAVHIHGAVIGSNCSFFAFMYLHFIAICYYNCIHFQLLRFLILYGDHVCFCWGWSNSIQKALDFLFVFLGVSFVIEDSLGPHWASFGGFTDAQGMFREMIEVWGR